MKKLLILPGLAALTLGLAACGGGETNQAANGTALNEIAPDDTTILNADDLPADNLNGEETTNLAGSSVVNGQ